MTQILALAVFLLAAFLLIFVHIWSDTAVEYDIGQNLTREVRKNLKYVRLENGKPLFLEGYDNETEDIFFCSWIPRELLWRETIRKSMRTMAGFY